MRRILLSAACLLLAAGAASAQTKAGHYGPISSPPGDTALVETHGQPNAPGHAAAVGAETASVGPYRGAHMGRGGMHHRMMRHHVSARVCIARAGARGLHGRAKTHYIQRCEVGRV